MSTNPDTSPVALSQVSVIVAARNEAEHLRPCVESLLAAGRGEAEIIVVDDASTDGSLRILEEYASRIRVLRGEGQGPGRARNLGLAAGRKPWVAFTDADCIVPPDWLAVLTEGIAKTAPSVSSIGGGQKISADARCFERNIGKFFESVGFVSDYIHSGSSPQPVNHNPTCNVLYRREALKAAGGFDESLWPCEDLDLDLRLKKLGYQALYHPAADVEHRRPTTLPGFVGMMKRYGFAHAQLVKKHGFCRPLQLLALLPWLLVIALGLLRNHASAMWGTFAILAAFVPFFFLFRGRSIGKAAVFTGFLCVGIPIWVFGFYCGLIGTRRINRHV